MAEISINKSVFFLFFIDSVCDLMGCDMAKGMLQRLGEKIARTLIEKFTAQKLEINSLEELAITDNPLKYFDDTLKFEDGRLYILERCPFADLIAAHKDIAGALPVTFTNITESYNLESLGYAVSPFCIIHQTFRREIANYIKIDGKSCELLQLGCKSGSGEIKFAKDNMELSATGEELVGSKLEGRACIYTLQVKE